MANSKTTCCRALYMEKGERERGGGAGELVRGIHVATC